MALESLFGYPAQTQQLPRFTPEQQSALNQLLSLGSANIQKPYEGFAPIEQQARTQFQTQTIPSIAERFTAMGGAQKGSSAFQGVLGSAASGLESQLAALKSQYGLQQRQQGLQQLGLGLTPSFENIYQPQTTGFLGGLAPALGQGLGYGLTGGFGGLGSGLSALLGLLGFGGGATGQNRLGGGQ